MGFFYMAFPTGWSFKKLYVPQAKVSGSANHSNFPVLIKDSVIPAAVYSGMQTGEINSSWIKQLANLKAYYRFESGALTTDSSGNSRTLTAIGSPTSGTGKYGGCVTLNGTNQAYSHANHSDFKPTGNFSIIAWIKTSQTATYSTIFQSYAQNTAVAGIFLIKKSDNKIYLGSGKNTGTVVGTDQQQVASTSTVTDGNWHLIIGTWDGSNLKMYVDGVLEGTTAWANAPVYQATNYVRIGCANYTGTNTEFFASDIDDLGILNGTALTAEQAKILYVGGGADLRFTTDSAGTTEIPFEIVSVTPASSLCEIHVKLPTLYYNQNTEFYVWYGKNDATPYAANATYGSQAVWTNYAAVYHMNEDSATALRDCTANANNSTTHTFTSTSASTMIGKGREGNGSQYAVIPDHASLNFSQITAQMIVDLDSTAEKGFLSKGLHASTSMEFSLWINSSNKWAFGVDSNGTWGPEVQTAGSSSIATGVRTLVHGIYNGSAAKIYENGAQIASTNGTVTPLNSTGSVYIGNFFDNTYAPDARFDEVRIRASALSADWISTENTMLNSPTTFVVGVIELALTETVTLVDTILRISSRSLAETVTLVDTKTLQLIFTKSLSETATLVDTIVKTPTRIFTETVALVDSVYKYGSRALSEVVTLVDTKTTLNVYLKELVESFTLVDTFVNIFSVKRFTESINVEDLFSRISVRTIALSEILTLVDIVLKEIRDVLTARTVWAKKTLGKMRWKLASKQDPTMYKE